MEGVVDIHLRQVFKDVGGVDACVTEFVRINDQRLPAKIFHRYCPELTMGIDQYLPIRIQLLGSNPQAIAYHARKACQLGAKAVDLNFGCPAKTVNKNRGGACLLDETELIYEIIARAKEQMPEGHKLSAKIRLGFNERDSYLENAQAIEKGGADELFVHARSKQDGYQPPAYWDCIGEIRNAIGIDVIANGEIWTVSDYALCKQQSGCDDFMLGRGLLANPGLARAIKGDSMEFSWSELIPCLQQYFAATSAAYPKKFIGNRLKQWLHYLQRHYPQARHLFERIKRSRDECFIRSAIEDSHR
jgi:tRNA-dihydrouridine synthase C